MDTGERAPKTESATAIVGRSAAIDAAFADFPELDDDYSPPAGESGAVETPSHDDGSDSASTQKPAASKPDGTTTVDEAKRPVEGQDGLSASQDPLKAPARWSEDRRKAFEALPHDAQRIILERDKEANVAVTRASQEAAQYRRTHEGLTSTFSDHHRQQMQQAGLDEVGAVRYLIEQHDALNRDPVGFLKAVIAQTRVTPEQLFGQQATPQQPQPQAEAVEDWQDPALIAVKQEMGGKLTALEQKVLAWEQERQTSQQTEQKRFQSWFTEQCNAFENAIDPEGNPKYPHLSSVMSDVVRLVQTDPEAKRLLTSDPAKALETAYNNALYLNPEIRQQIMDAEYQRRMADRDRQSAVSKAQAASTRKGSPGANGHAQPKVNMSREEAITKAMAEFGL